jgi:hypothetical protein
METTPELIATAAVLNNLRGRIVTVVRDDQVNKVQMATSGYLQDYMNAPDGRSDHIYGCGNAEAKGGATFPLKMVDSIDGCNIFLK